MANIYLGDDGSGADFGAFSFDFLTEYPGFNYRFSSINGYQDDQNYTFFRGDKLIYRGTDGGILLDPSEQDKPISAVVGGTIKGLLIVQNGVTVLNVANLNISAKQLYDAVIAHDSDAIKTMLLSGDDTIIGTRHNDRIEGRGGNDELRGGNGNDTVYGGIGADTLSAGAGKDVFVFKHLSDSTVAATGQDMIMDFSLNGRDRMDLSAIDANAKLGGNQAFSFVDTHAFTGKAGELRFEKTAFDTYVYADVNGDKVADFAIHLNGAIDLYKGDFIL